MSSSSHPRTTPPGVGHEHTDVSVRPIVVAGIGLGTVLLIVAALMLGLYDVFAAREARLSPPANPLAAAEAPRLPPQPRLQVHPVKDLRELRAAESKILEHYGWVDKQAGVVRIPIQRAIDLLAARAQKPEGAPAR
jgi:hypothetical protein